MLHDRFETFFETCYEDKEDRIIPLIFVPLPGFTCDCGLHQNTKLPKNSVRKNLRSRFLFLIFKNAFRGAKLRWKKRTFVVSVIDLTTLDMDYIFMCRLGMSQSSPYAEKIA